MMQYAAELELETEEASSFQNDLLETSSVLQIPYLVMEESKSQNMKSNLPRLSTQKLKRTVSLH
jgi:hypothetical protein